MSGERPLSSVSPVLNERDAPANSMAPLRSPSGGSTIDDAGVWCGINKSDWGFRPALFLDRDGVIVVDTDYLGRPEDLRMIEGAAAAIARCNASGIPVVVVTNQSGISRGYYDWDGFHAVQAALVSELRTHGAHLDAVLACAYHGEGLEPLRSGDHPWRKPNPGMLLAAAAGMNLDLSLSWIIGDRVHDLAAGAAAGLAGGTLLASDRAELPPAALPGRSGFIVETAATTAYAVDRLLGSGRLEPRARS